ncbi:MAG: hypothetical protein RL571_1174 [Pseudomonadota bacterium]|jgi:hypothetical protein
MLKNRRNSLFNAISKLCNIGLRLIFALSLVCAKENKLSKHRITFV